MKTLLLKLVLFQIFAVLPVTISGCVRSGPTETPGTSSCISPQVCVDQLGTQIERESLADKKKISPAELLSNEGVSLVMGGFVSSVDFIKIDNWQEFVDSRVRNYFDDFDPLENLASLYKRKRRLSINVYRGYG